jgi:hypothetical protein
MRTVEGVWGNREVSPARSTHKSGFGFAEAMRTSIGLRRYRRASAADAGRAGIGGEGAFTGVVYRKT